MNKMSKYTTIILIVFTLFIFSSCSRRAKPREMPVPEISVAQPEVKNIILTKDYPGYLTSEQTVNLVARINGTIQSVSFKPGSMVRQGDLLFVIEPSLYQDNVTKAKAALETAQAQLEYAQSSYSRMKEAAKSDAVSEIQVIQSAANVTEAIAAVNNAKAGLNTARTNLSYCYIRAPFSGTIDRNVFDVGNYVSGAMQPVTLATLYKNDKMYVYFNIEDNQYMKMLLAAKQGGTKPGAVYPVTIKLGNNANVTYQGTLDYLAPNVDLSTGTLNVRAEIPNQDNTLKSGLYVMITLPYGEKDKALLVREASIGTDQLGKYLYIVNDSNKVQYQHITPGELIGDSLREVTSGIQAGQQYVTTALLKVRNGMTVKPVK